MNIKSISLILILSSFAYSSVAHPMPNSKQWGKIALIAGAVTLIGYGLHKLCSETDKHAFERCQKELDILLIYFKPYLDGDSFTLKKTIVNSHSDFFKFIQFQELIENLIHRLKSNIWRVESISAHLKESTIQPGEISALNQQQNNLLEELLNIKAKVELSPEYREEMMQKRTEAKMNQSMGIRIFFGK